VSGTPQRRGARLRTLTDLHDDAPAHRACFDELEIAEWLLDQGTRGRRSRPDDIPARQPRNRIESHGTPVVRAPDRSDAAWVRSLEMVSHDPVQNGGCGIARLAPLDGCTTPNPQQKPDQLDEAFPLPQRFQADFSPPAPAPPSGPSSPWPWQPGAVSNPLRRHAGRRLDLASRTS
jgi:hypothetical protein